MFVLFLKLILAFVLTAIPFAFRYWLKPKGENSPRWKNSISILENKLPYLLKMKRMFVAWLLRVYRKMKFSRNARKFFTYLLIVSMLIVQAVDFQASKAANEKLAEYAPTSITEHQTSKDSPCTLSDQGESIKLIQSQVTPFAEMVICLLITMAAFSYRLSDFVLTKIHNVDDVKMWLVIIITAGVMVGEGRLLLVAEIMYLILVAGLVYPNHDFQEYGKWHKRITKQTRSCFRCYQSSRAERMSA